MTWILTGAGPECSYVTWRQQPLFLSGEASQARQRGKRAPIPDIMFPYGGRTSLITHELNAVNTSRNPSICVELMLVIRWRTTSGQHGIGMLSLVPAAFYSNLFLAELSQRIHWFNFLPVSAQPVSTISSRCSPGYKSCTLMLLFVTCPRRFWELAHLAWWRTLQCTEIGSLGTSTPTPPYCRHLLGVTTSGPTQTGFRIFLSVVSLGVCVSGGGEEEIAFFLFLSFIRRHVLLSPPIAQIPLLTKDFFSRQMNHYS